jgi:16S rRNA (guanine527-N7)-methyltransferase
MDAAVAIGVHLPEPQARRLVEFERLLAERAVPAGMVARGDLSRLRERHVLDSLRAVVAVEETDRSAYDLGSGAGLPGVVVAIARPDLAMTLVETRRRRAAFLELAVERLRLRNVVVAPRRIEALLEGPVDLCFARALAPLEEAWALAEPLLNEAGRLVWFAGEGAARPWKVPGARVVSVPAAPVLERAGPLAIIARQ